MATPNFLYTDRSLKTSIQSTSTDKLKDYGYKSSLNKILIGTRYEQFEDVFFSPNLSLSDESIKTDSTASTAYKKQEGSYFDLIFDYGLSFDKRNSRFQPSSGFVSKWYQSLPLVSDDTTIINGYQITGYKQIADQVGLVFANNRILLEEMLNNLFFIAASDGQISLKEIELLRSISQSFSFDEKTFQRIFQMNLNNKDADPYKILGVSRNDDDKVIRKKWILLNKEHHPDNLIAKGMPKEFIEKSNKELASINLAYDKIKELRGVV